MSDHNLLTPRDESLADDLNKERGDVRGRVALLPRSAEAQPWFRRSVSTHAHAWRRTARFPPSRGGCDGRGAARASPACGEARRTRTLARGLGVAANKHKQTLKHLAPARRSFGQRPRRAACASRAWEASGGCADDQRAIDTGVVVSRWRARGGSRLPSLPAPCSTKGWRAGPTGPTTHALINAAPLRIPPPPERPMPNQEHCVPFSLLCPWEPRLRKLTPAHSPVYV